MLRIILCALNEAQNLKILLPEIAHQIQKINQKFEIILCIDGSNDNSEEYILSQKNSYPIRILPIIDQKGLGKAAKRLFLEAFNEFNDDDIVISLDADNTHLPYQIEEIVRYFEKNQESELLILSRFCENSKIKGFPRRRILISILTSLTLQTIFRIKRINGKNVKDFSSGYRAYKNYKIKELINKLGDNFIRQSDFTHTCELLINFKKVNAKFDEIGLDYDYSKKIGESKLNFWGNSVSLVKLIFREMFL